MFKGDNFRSLYVGDLGKC